MVYLSSKYVMSKILSGNEPERRMKVGWEATSSSSAALLYFSLFFSGISFLFFFVYIYQIYRMYQYFYMYQQVLIHSSFQLWGFPLHTLGRLVSFVFLIIISNVDIMAFMMLS